VTAVNLLLALALLLANGFFVAVEFALLASRRTKLESMAEAGSVRARAALGSIRHLNHQLAGAQLGITMASLLLGFIAEPAVAELVESAVERFVELPPSVLDSIGFVVALAIVVFLHMVLGEMVPKNIAIAAPERTLLALTFPNRAYVAIFGPVMRMLNLIANGIVRLVGVEPRDELSSSASAQELSMMLEASREEGLIEEVAHQLLTGALDLGARRITSVMVPASRVVWLPRSATPEDAERLVVSSGHSRIVVAGTGLDDPLGFLHAKDMLTLPPSARRGPLPLGLVRRMLVLTDRTSLDDALAAMQQARTHMAVVSGPTGATLGVVTLEDVIEELVGDIRDESDR